jgi:hypothetical protein
MQRRSVIALLAFVFAGCAQNTTRPSEPVDQTATTVSGPFTLSGTITEYRGGPLPGVLVTARPNTPPGPLFTAVTEASGTFRFDGLTVPTRISAEKAGFWPAGTGSYARTSVVNLPLARTMRIAAGETLAATIWGDSALSGEDWTGASCDHKACQMATVTAPTPGTLTARLQWDGPSELGVFISTGFFGGHGASGPPPLEASLDVGAGETLVVISFERFAGRPIGPTLSQTYELSTGFAAR